MQNLWPSRCRCAVEAECWFQPEHWKMDHNGPGIHQHRSSWFRWTEVRVWLCSLWRRLRIFQISCSCIDDSLAQFAVLLKLSCLLDALFIVSWLFSFNSVVWQYFLKHPTTVYVFPPVRFLYVRVDKSKNIQMHQQFKCFGLLYAKVTRGQGYVLKPPLNQLLTCCTSF